MIARNFSSAAKVGVAVAQVDFGFFNKVVEGETNFVNVGIHGGGHYSVGGEVSFFFFLLGLVWYGLGWLANLTG